LIGESNGVQAIFEKVVESSQQVGHSEGAQINVFWEFDRIWDLVELLILQHFQNDDRFIHFQGFICHQVEQSYDGQQLIYWDVVKVTRLQIQISQIQEDSQLLRILEIPSDQVLESRHFN
jgi:hypothetical protein